MLNTNRHFKVFAAAALAVATSAALAQAGPFGEPVLLKPRVVQPIKAAAPQAPQFYIRSGDKLKETLEAWAKEAGWSLVWAYDGDFVSGGGAVFTSDFKVAVRELFDALPDHLPLAAELKPDNSPPMLLVKAENRVRP